MKKIKFMDCSFRDGFQSCLGARVKTDDFLPALDAAVKAGINYIEIGGGLLMVRGNCNLYLSFLNMPKSWFPNV